jgi:exonuclease III
MRVLTWNMNGIRSVVDKFGNMKALLEALSAGMQAGSVLCKAGAQLQASTASHLWSCASQVQCVS